MDSNVVNFKLNKPQMMALFVNAADILIMMARGTGKTQGITAPWTIHKKDVMPRSTGGLICQTFTDGETKILQPLFLGFQMMGFEIDNHYVYGRRPPADWDKPLTPVLDYDHVISFPNGSNVVLISLHLKGSANSLSLQYVVGPEAKFFNEKQLRQEVFPILRGHKKHFGDCPWYGAKLLETDKYAPNIHWLLDKRKLHNQDMVNAVIFYQSKINDLRIKLEQVSDSHSYKLMQEIHRLESVVAQLRRRMTYVGEASAHDNQENLPDDYIANQKRDLTDYEFRVAILNEDPTNVEQSYYPDRTQDHLFYANADDITKPLGIVLDNQASLSPLVSFQLNDMLIPGVITLNYLESVYVKHPLGIKHVINNFCDSHRLRTCKEVYYFYDHTMIAERNMHGSFSDDVIKYFKDNSWKVTPIYMGQAPNQSDKYNRIKHYLQNKEHKPYPIRIHGSDCNVMLVSMNLTGTKETDKGTKKDKTSEKDSKFPQEKATHFSDCFDMVVWAVLELNLYPLSSSMPLTVGFRK